MPDSPSECELSAYMQNKKRQPQRPVSVLVGLSLCSNFGLLLYNRMILHQVLFNPPDNMMPVYFIISFYSSSHRMQQKRNQHLVLTRGKWMKWTETETFNFSTTIGSVTLIFKNKKGWERTIFFSCVCKIFSKLIHCNLIKNKLKETMNL